MASSVTSFPSTWYLGGIYKLFVSGLRRACIYQVLVRGTTLSLNMVTFSALKFNIRVIGPYVKGSSGIRQCVIPGTGKYVKETALSPLGKRATLP